MKIVVITDLHANLPALKAVLDAVSTEGYDLLVHTGDAIAIGPYSPECLDVLLDTPNVRCLMGNHEAFYVDGLPDPLPGWMDEGECAHQQWVHRQLGDERRALLRAWPYRIAETVEGVRVQFVHYGLAVSGRDFVSTVRNPTAEDLDGVFGEHDFDVVFYGHDHKQSDVQGRGRYVNPGSLGCYKEAIARYCVLEITDGQYALVHRQIAYDDRELFAAFERRKVPVRDFLYRAFFGGRFGT